MHTPTHTTLDHFRTLRCRDSVGRIVNSAEAILRHFGE